MKVRFIAISLAIAFAAGPAPANDPFLRRTTTVQVVEKVGPAVVNITTETVVARRSPFGNTWNDPFFDRFFRDFFEPRVPRTAQSLGSGVIFDEKGHILTNAHVIGRADRIRVSLADGGEFEATLIGADPNNDLAVLKAETDRDLPWIPLSTSADLMVGEPVIAIGNPFGLSNSVTTGVISAADRSIRTDKQVYHGFLQTDASINPGNSGGPLLNAEGKLIGINTAVYNGGQGIGFAIPVDVARRVVRELIAHGEVTPVWLGLELQDLSPELQSALGLPGTLGGALVNRVRDESPGAEAGLRREDVVMRVDGHAVTSARGFYEILVTVTPRQVVEVDYWRRGKEYSKKIRAEQVPPRLIATLTHEMLGMELELREETGGFRIAKIREGSGAERIGLRAGDVVLAINGRGVRSDEALRRSVLDLRGSARAMVMVHRGTGRYNVTIPLL